MAEKNCIRLLDLMKTDDNKLVYTFDFPDSLKTYFSGNQFYVKYGKNVKNVKDSILYIPGVSCLLTLAWIKNVDVKVSQLDETFFNSLSEVKDALNKLFPEMRFKGGVIAEEIVHNEYNNDGYGLLFSGGVDSTCLYLRIKRYMPELFTILGGVVPINNHTLIRKIKHSVEAFAGKEQLKVNFIETNIREVINEGLLTSEYAKFFPNPEKTWWDAINYGIIQLGLCAPLTSEGIGKMVFGTNGNYSHGGNSRLVTRIRYSDVETLPEGKYYWRFEKLKKFYKNYVDETNFFPILRVCIYSPVASDRFNCCSCEKCAFTIISLLLAGVNPVKSGFPINKGFFEHVTKTILPNANSKTTWINIQENIEKNFSGSIDYSKPFFKTFQSYKFHNLGKHRQKTEFGLNSKWTLFNIYYRLPKVIQIKLLNMFYNRIYLKLYSRAHTRNQL